MPAKKTNTRDLVITAPKRKRQELPGDLVVQNETTQMQLALDIFSALSPVDETIDASPQEIGFRKNNIFLDISGLGLAARRAVDVAYFIVAQSADENELYSTDKNYTYSVDQNFFKWLMGTSSRNWSHLRAVLREAQGGAIEITDIDDDFDVIENGADVELELELDPPKSTTSRRSKRQSTSADPEKYPAKWISVQLIGSVALRNGRVYFEVNPALAQHIKNPKSSHFLSLRYVFRSLYAKLLYDLVLPYASNGLTPWFELESFKKSLECTGKTYDQFKFLRQFILLPAVKEINTLTDLSLEVQTHNLPKTRKIGFVRFKVERNENAPQDPNIELKDLFLTLRNEFSVSNVQMDEILKNREEWSIERIKEAIEYTRYQIEHGKVRISASGYLMRALRENYTIGSAQRIIDAQNEARAAGSRPWSSEPLPPTELPPNAPEFPATERAKMCEEGWRRYQELDGKGRKQMIAEFAQTPQARLAAMSDRVELHEISQYLDQPGLLREEFGIFAQSYNARAEEQAPKAPRAQKGKKGSSTPTEDN